MNLDSIVTVRLQYEVETTVAELVETWLDGEIAELLEDDPDAVASLEEEAIDYALATEAEVEEVEIE
jgi:hypothetical protein